MMHDIKKYDFKKPQRYSSDNMRFVSVIAEEFCKNINIFLNYELKQKNLVCKVERVEQTNYEEFTNIINSDSVIVEHAIQPLVNGLIYQIDKAIALTFIDCMLGGDGDFEDYTRELTEIDKRLIHHVSDSFLSKLHVVEGCEYREVMDVHLNLSSSKKYPISESVLIAHMKMMRGNKEIGKMRFCKPYSCMEPILPQLETKKLFKSKNVEYDFEFTNAIYNNVYAASTDVVALLGKAKVKVQELLDLNVGDVIKLDTKPDEEIELYIAGSKSFKCKPGLIGYKKGVIIVDGVGKEE